jgi:peptidyl-dipeptidase Dcp
MTVMNQQNQTLAGAAGSENPLLPEASGPFRVPPFDRIKPEHFPPAFAHAFAAHAAEVAAIAADPSEPTFANTIVALERGGDALTRVGSVFHVLAGAHTNDAILEIERDLAPQEAKHWNRILMDENLFRRIDALQRRKDQLGLTAEEGRVLDRYHVMFTRAGAALDAAAKARLAEINERLATLGTSFAQNVLADEQGYTLVLEGEDDLAGLPDFVRAAARAAAEERGLADKHVITTSRSSADPFLQFSARRDLREKIFRAWVARGDGGGATDNKAIIAEMVVLRAERARLLGYPTFAHYRLDDAMAKTPEAVRALLDRVWAPARQHAMEDRDALQSLEEISRSRRGTGATTRRSCARRAATSTRRRSSRTSCSSASSRRPSTPRTVCLGSPSSGATAFRSGTRMCGCGRCATPPGATAACSSATISPVPRSTAAPG